LHEPGSLPHRPEYNPRGNLLRHQPIRTGAFADAAGSAERESQVLERLRHEASVVVSAEYEVGMQDQAFLGTESGMEVPAEDGGVVMYVATHRMHVDLLQLQTARRCVQVKDWLCRA